MQWLLGENTSGTDASFLRELFLQRLPSNVHIVFTSTNTTSLDDLAQLANQIMEIAIPSISNVTASIEVEQLLAKIGDLKRLVQLLLTPKA